MKNCNDNYPQFSGTQSYIPMKSGGNTVLLTEGVHFIASKTQSWWFLDLILSHRKPSDSGRDIFRVWKLMRVKKNDNKFTAVCEDGNGNIIKKQEIPYSDFPYDSYTLWESSRVILLPSEH